MSATTYAPRPKRSGSGDGGNAEWTEEQKAAYKAQWDNFAKLMAKRSHGQTRDFDATILAISDPFEEEKEFQGQKTKRRARTIKVQLAQRGVDMLRWQENSADNPFNEKTLLRKVIVAVTGQVPDPEVGFEINFADLIGKKVRVSIEKQGERTDGMRGGFWSKLRDIQPLFEDEDELEAPAQPPAPSTSAPKKADDELPWGAD